MLNIFQSIHYNIKFTKRNYTNMIDMLILLEINSFLCKFATRTFFSSIKNIKIIHKENVQDNYK